MKNVLLGIFFVFSMTAFGQQGLASTSSLVKKVRTVSTYKAPVKVEVVEKTEKSKKKVYAYLTRMVTSVSNEELEKRKVTIK